MANSTPIASAPPNPNHTSDLRTKKSIWKGTPMSISAIQLMLNERGYSELLHFQEFGAGGSFGPMTRNVSMTYARNNGIESDGDLLTRPLMDLMLHDNNAFYGSSWSDLAVNNLPAQNSPLILFEASRFISKPCQAEVQFNPMLPKINRLAEQANVFIKITSSFRTSSNVAGAIVKPPPTPNIGPATPLI